MCRLCSTRTGLAPPAPAARTCRTLQRARGAEIKLSGRTTTFRPSIVDHACYHAGWEYPWHTRLWLRSYGAIGNTEQRQQHREGQVRMVVQMCFFSCSTERCYHVWWCGVVLSLDALVRRHAPSVVHSGAGRRRGIPT